MGTTANWSKVVNLVQNIPTELGEYKYFKTSIAFTKDQTISFKLA